MSGLDDNMNQGQRRAFAAKMRTCKDPHEALIAARLRGWIPDGKKSVTFAYQV